MFAYCLALLPILAAGAWELAIAWVAPLGLAVAVKNGGN